jgi:hypothetical protein
MNDEEENVMVKKTAGSRPAKPVAKPGTALVPVPVARGGQLVTTGDAGAGSVFREKGVTLVAGQPYAMGDRSIIAGAVYYVDVEAGNRRDGRLGEADKIAWLDPATGYECIIMREPRGEYLRGFVGVEPGHPLYGFGHKAVPPELDIEVHGGLTYSAVCQKGSSPQPRLLEQARAICHVLRPARFAPIVDATDHHAGADAWWFGFDCNHIYDLVPGEPRDRARFLGGETGATFKDDGYVYDQVVDLAAQLRAIADGMPKPPRTGPPPPPLGLDPRRAS